MVCLMDKTDTVEMYRWSGKELDDGTLLTVYDDWSSMLELTDTTMKDWIRLGIGVWMRNGTPGIRLRVGANGLVEGRRPLVHVLIETQDEHVNSLTFRSDDRTREWFKLAGMMELRDVMQQDAFCMYERLIEGDHSREYHYGVADGMRALGFDPIRKETENEQSLERQEMNPNETPAPSVNADVTELSAQHNCRKARVTADSLLYRIDRISHLLTDSHIPCDHTREQGTLRELTNALHAVNETLLVHKHEG